MPEPDALCCDVLPCDDEPELLGEALLLELLGEALLLELLGEALLPELLGEALLPELLGEALLPELIELWLPCDDDVPDVEPDELPELDSPPCTLSAASVCWSSWPDAGRFCCCWNCLIAFSVFGPILPSTWPTSRPFCWSACWAWRISELLADEEDEDDCPAWPPIDELPWSCEELDDCCAPWLLELPWSCEELDDWPDDFSPLEPLVPMDWEDDGLDEDWDEGLDEEEELFPCASATPVESDRMAAAMAVFWKFMVAFLSMSTCPGIRRASTVRLARGPEHGLLQRLCPAHGREEARYSASTRASCLRKATRR